MENTAKKFLGKFETILDVGCGIGDLLIYFSKKGYEVLGIDKSEIMVELAREKARNLGLMLTYCVLMPALSDHPSLSM